MGTEGRYKCNHKHLTSDGFCLQISVVTPNKSMGPNADLDRDADMEWTYNILEATVSDRCTDKPSAITLVN